MEQVKVDGKTAIMKRTGDVAREGIGIPEGKFIPVIVGEYDKVGYHSGEPGLIFPKGSHDYLMAR